MTDNNITNITIEYEDGSSWVFHPAPADQEEVGDRDEALEYPSTNYFEGESGWKISIPVDAVEIPLGDLLEDDTGYHVILTNQYYHAIEKMRPEFHSYSERSNTGTFKNGRRFIILSYDRAAYSVRGLRVSSWEEASCDLSHPKRTEAIYAVESGMNRKC